MSRISQVRCVTNQKGFTLIEILIALAVFTVLSALTASVLNHAFETRNRINILTERLNNFQYAMMLIQREVQQLVPRPVRNTANNLLPIFIGKSDYVEFTRGGIGNPLGQEKRSHLKRIAYLCTNNQLIRRTWAQLDASNREQYQDRVLLNNLSKCNFAYLSHNLQVLSEWREDAVEFTPKSLPKAVQFDLKKDGQIKLNWLTIIPPALYAESQI